MHGRLRLQTEFAAGPSLMVSGSSTRCWRENYKASPAQFEYFISLGAPSQHYETRATGGPREATPVDHRGPRHGGGRARPRRARAISVAAHRCPRPYPPHPSLQPVESSLSYRPYLVKFSVSNRSEADQRMPLWPKFWLWIN